MALVYNAPLPWGVLVTTHPVLLTLHTLLVVNMVWGLTIMRGVRL